MKFTQGYSTAPAELKRQIAAAEAIVVGAGSGLSASAGLVYGGERFFKYFSDFHAKYGIRDMYSGGFYPFKTLEEYWAWWSRHIFYNRYVEPPKPVYDELFKLVAGRDYFVITTNVDHCFQRAGFEKKRLFYTQGDYGLLQCSVPCHSSTYDNEEFVRRMVREQRDMKIPSELIPRCPVCCKPMTVNLRSDSTFVQDSGWQSACARYEDFIKGHKSSRVLYLELGVGGNTPAIIKFLFWRLTRQNKNAFYACVNSGEAFCPQEIEGQSICIDGDIGEILTVLNL